MKRTHVGCRLARPPAHLGDDLLLEFEGLHVVGHGVAHLLALLEEAGEEVEGAARVGDLSLPCAAHVSNAPRLVHSDVSEAEEDVWGVKGWEREERGKGRGRWRSEGEDQRRGKDI